MTLLLGQIATAKGPCTQVDGAGDVEYFTMEPGSYLRSQPSPMPVYFSHDKSWRIGEVVRLFRSDADGLLAFMDITADIEDLLSRHEWRISEGGVTTSPPYRMRELSLVDQTANRWTRPVQWSRSSVPPSGMPIRWYAQWDAGVEYLNSYTYRRRRPDVLNIVDLDRLGIVEEVLTDPDAALAKSRAIDAAKAKSAPPLVVDPVLHRRSAVPKVFYYGTELHGEAAAQVIDQWIEAHP